MTSKFVLKLLRSGVAKSSLPSITDVGVIGEPIFTRPSFVDTVNDIRVQYAKRNVEAIPGVDTIYVVSIGVDEQGSTLVAIMSDGKMYSIGYSDWGYYAGAELTDPFIIESPSAGNLARIALRQAEGGLLLDENGLLYALGYFDWMSTIPPTYDYNSMELGAGSRVQTFLVYPYDNSPVLSTLGRGQYPSAGIDADTKLWIWGSDGGGWGLLGQDYRFDIDGWAYDYVPIEIWTGIWRGVANVGWTHIHCGWQSVHGIREGGLWFWGPNVSGIGGLGCDQYLDDNRGHKWTLSSNGSNEYYVEKLAGGDPEIVEPTQMYVYWSGNSGWLEKGIIGGLSIGEWNWGDNDGLGYSTVYVRLKNNADPDGYTNAMRPQWNAPVRVGIDSDWAKVMCQEETTVALKTNGVLYGWGNNYKGSMGHDPGTCVDYDRVDTTPPITWCEHWTPKNISQGKTFVDFSAGYYHIIALESDGTAWVIGYDDYDGALGLGDNIDSLYVWTEIPEIKFDKIECHYDANIGVGLDGKVYVWGGIGVAPYNYYVPTVWNFGTYWEE